jgi:hypothetical protein
VKLCGIDIHAHHAARRPDAARKRRRCLTARQSFIAWGCCIAMHRRARGQQRVKYCPLVQRPHVSFRRMRTLPCSPAAPPQEESARDWPELRGLFRRACRPARLCADPRAHLAMTMQTLLSPAADMLPHWLWAAMCQQRSLSKHGDRGPRARWAALGLSEVLLLSRAIVACCLL